MSASTEQQFFARIRVTKNLFIPLRLTAMVAGFLLMVTFLTGCGGGEGEAVAEPAPAPLGITTTLAWNPVQDPTVSAYFIHYGRQSPGQPGSCSYEDSIYTESPSATVTHLDPETVYFFTVSAYNGVESQCSIEVSTVTPPASV